MPPKRQKRAAAARDVLPKGNLGKRVSIERGVTAGELRRTPKALRGVADIGEGSIAEKRPNWGISLMDQEHNGSWTWQMAATEINQLLTFLREMERLTWQEIWAQLFNSKGGSHKKHHWMPAEEICTEAKKRLDEIGLGDQEQLFRFRLNNKARLWGIIMGRTFYPVWWDNDHKVYPTSP